MLASTSGQAGGTVRLSPTGPVLKTEDDITKAIDMIVSMTRQLFKLPDGFAVDVHVRPQNRAYTVTVDVAGFTLRKSDFKLSKALEELLTDLSTRVHEHLALLEAAVK